MNTSKRGKRVVKKGWMITDRKREYPYCAYFDENEARGIKKENAVFHKNDVIVPCEITYFISK